MPQVLMNALHITPLVYHLHTAAILPHRADETVPLSLIPAFLLVFLICAIISFLVCRLAKALFPRFRSGEHKPGTHRPDLPAGGREIKTIELPLIGGPSFILAIIGTGLATGYLFFTTPEQWALLYISLGATFGYALVGFMDDWRKVYSN